MIKFEITITETENKNLECYARGEGTGATKQEVQESRNLVQHILNWKNSQKGVTDIIPFREEITITPGIPV